MNLKTILLMYCVLAAIVVGDSARHCDADRRFCYATYMISNERLGAYMPTVVSTVAAYCSNASNVPFATSLFASRNDSRPSYALGDLLFRDGLAEAHASKLYWVHATVTQVCDMDALHCRYTAGYNTPRSIAIPGMTRYTTSANVSAAVIAPLPPAFFVSRWKGACPAANDTISPLGTMPPAGCITYVGAAVAFRLCVPGMAEQMLTGCVTSGTLSFCAIVPPDSMTADVVPEGMALSTAIVPGVFFTSHPMIAAVEITSTASGASVSAAGRLMWLSSFI